MARKGILDLLSIGLIGVAEDLPVNNRFQILSKWYHEARRQQARATAQTTILLWSRWRLLAEASVET